MNNRHLKYWACQIVGWGFWCVVGLYLTFIVYGDSFRQVYSNNAEDLQVAKQKYFYSMIIFLVSAIAVTHALRYILKKIRWERFSFNRLLLIFVISTLLSGTAFYKLTMYAESIFGVSLESFRNKMRLENALELEKQVGLDTIAYYKLPTPVLSATQLSTIKQIQKTTKYTRTNNGEWQVKDSSDVGIIYQCVILCSLWLLIYLIWHYIENNRSYQIDRIKLEATVKELELKTIKAHVNPHFIFNSLNSIRALVDENPERARTAITRLSNLLRSSMHASESNDTVPLSKEILIVKDYLALEKIRFEDRLQINWNIEEDSNQQQVPPMMLQTLVENAIKHGISKQIHGGTVTIKSNFVQSHYELLVANTGTLGKNDYSGFGIASTINRLQLLYNAHAKFKIEQLNPNTVQVTVILPVQLANA